MPVRAALRPFAIAAAVCLPLTACKPASQKVTLGPFTADRYEANAADGSRLDCYVLGPDSDKPVRLCGDGQPTPGFTGYFFNAVAPAPGSRFTESIGAPIAPGWYVLRPMGASLVDSWPLGRLPMHEWLGNGKGLLGVETGADHHTHVHLIDPQARSDRNFDVGEMRSDNFFLVRAPDDAALLLIQRRGGEEMILVRDPLGNQELAVGNSADDKSPGNRRFYKRGDLMRQNGGQFIPSAADLANITWKGTAPSYEGQPMGPFEIPPSLR